MTARDGSIRRETFDADEVTIGRVGGNDLVIPMGNISKRHARIVVKHGRIIVVDLKSTNGTYVNGRKVTSPMVVTEDDKINIGDYAVTLSETDVFEDEPTVEVEATELRLLAAIAQRDEVSREVYADWLEEHGDHVRAEFLRVQDQITGMSPEDPMRELGADRLRVLAASIEIGWRYKVARPAIELCASFELECPKQWGALATTERSNVRYCGTCEKQVFYCATVAQARQHATRGNCVAIDATNVRNADDLAIPAQPRMGRIRIVPRETDYGTESNPPPPSMTRGRAPGDD